MNINHTKMTLEINSCKNYEILEVRQGDKGSRIIDFAFTVNGETVNLASTMSAKVNATVDDVIVADSVAAVVDTENNVVTVTLTDTMLALSGICKMDIVLMEGDEIITAETVCLRIGKSVINDDSKAFPGASSIVEITKEVENARGGQNSLGARLDTVDTNLTKKANKSDIDLINSRLQSAEQNLHIKANATDVANALKSKEDKLNKVSSKADITDRNTNYPSIEYLGEYYYDANESYSSAETDELLGNKADSNSVYSKVDTDNLLGGKADKADVTNQFSKLRDDLDDIRKVSPNIFDKNNVVVGYRLSDVFGEYTAWGSRTSYSFIFPEIKTEPFRLYFSQAITGLNVWKEKNGSYEKLNGVNTFQQDENGNFYYDVTSITPTRYASCFAIEFTTANVDNNSLMVTLNTVSDKYVPFGNILYSEGEKVVIGSELPTSVTNDDNTSLGKGSMTEESNSKYNVAIGVNTMKTVQNKGQVDEGYYNVAVGHNAMPLLENGSHNTAIGFQALNKNVSGHYNTACGEDALFNTTGSNNTGCGCRALQDNTSGTHNVAVGGSLIHNTDGFRNNAIGNGAGNSVTKDSRCNFFGFEADKNTDEIITNSMALGHSAKVTKSNQVVIGNASVEEFVLGNKRIIFNSDGTVLWEIIN